MEGNMGKTECGMPEEAPAMRARPEDYPRSEVPEAPDFHNQWTEVRTQNARLEAAIVVLKTRVADLTAENAVLTAKIRQTELAPEKLALSNWGPCG
jgi:hypothetical protein